MMLEQDNKGEAFTALENFWLDLARQEIDRQFEAMAEDESYQALNEQIANEFTESDWDAWVEGETSQDDDRYIQNRAV